MCTRVMWQDGDTVLVGRNMDWLQDLGTNLWVMPRGADRDGAPEDPHPLRWTARYGSVVATAYDLATTDGINERGLGAHLLWLAESDFGERDPELPAVSVATWAQLFLDRFATVAECVDFLAREPFQVRPQEDPVSGRLSTVHLALDDAGGDSAIIEYLDGTAKLHHAHGYAVMTNSPPFAEQLTHLRRYQGFGGEQPLPGTTEAADRFVRASYYLSRLPSGLTLPRRYAALLSVMRNAAQPFGLPDPDRPHISMTIWRTLADLTHRVYAFESTFRPNLVWVELDRLDLDRWQRLDLAADGRSPGDLAGELAGEVSGRFVEAAPMHFQPA